MNNLQDDRNKIVEEYADLVWRIALSRTRQEEAAEDVVQEVFLDLFRKERQFKDEEHRKAWLIRATMLGCKQYRAAAFRAATVSLEELGDSIAAVQEQSNVYEALLRLPVKYRLPLQLYYIEEMDSDACAKALGLRPVTFRVRLHRGRDLLKKELKGEGIDV